MDEKDIRKLLRKAKKQGFQIDKTGKNYAIVRTAAGEFITRTPTTPKKPGAVNRLRRALEKQGFRS